MGRHHRKGFTDLGDVWYNEKTGQWLRRAATVNGSKPEVIERGQRSVARPVVSTVGPHVWG